MDLLENFLRSAAGKSALVATAIIALIFSLGPFIDIGGKRPLDSFMIRTLLSLMVMLCAVVVTLLLKRLRESKNDELASATAPGKSGSAALMESMERASRELRKGMKVGDKRVRLYELPWYVLIGPPGNGKTTALRKSGLHWPMRDLTGSEFTQGSQGTRNCTWWVSDRAVFLDTAGRYSVPEGDGQEEAKEWRSFLGKLRKIRQPIPLNGIILTVGADRLLESSGPEFVNMCDQLSQRVLEIIEMCGARIPVYLTISKIDRLSGFVELFKDAEKSFAEDPMGVTFADTDAGPAAQTEEALRSLVDRIDQYAFREISGLKGQGGQRALAVDMLTFPRQLQAALPRITKLVEGVYGVRSYSGFSPWIRGLYLISSVQQGELINQLAQRIQRDLKVQLHTGPSAHRSEGNVRAYFLPGLMRKVILKEAGISGESAATLARPRWVTALPHAAIATLAVVLGGCLLWSYSNNRALVAEIQKRAEKTDMALEDAPWQAGEVARGIEDFLALIDAAGAQEPSPSLGYRWMLYQGSSLHARAVEQYQSYATVALLMPLARALEAELRAPDTPASVRYDALRGYITLGSTEEKSGDKKYIAAIAERVWTKQLGQDPAIASLKRGLERLLDLGRVPVDVDHQLIDLNRLRLTQAPAKTIGSIAVERFKAAQAVSRRDDQLQGVRALTFADVLGPEGLMVFQTARSGDAVSAWMRGDALDRSTAALRAEVEQIVADSWVLGDGARDLGGVDPLYAAATMQYANEYVAAWSGLVESLQLDISGSSRDLETLVARLTPAAGMAGPMESALMNILRELDRPDVGQTPPNLSPPAMVRSRFAALIGFVNGTARPSLAEIRAALLEIRSEISAFKRLATDPAYSAAMGAGHSQQISQMVRERAASVSTLPTPMRGWFEGPLRKVSDEASRGALDQQRQAQLAKAIPLCSDQFLQSYPFKRNAQDDAKLGEVAEMLSPSGATRSHIASVIKPQVQQVPGRWTWRQGAEFSGVIEEQLLERLRRIEYFGDRLFPDGSRIPTFEASIEALAVPSNVSRVQLDIRGELVEIYPASGRFQWRADEQVDGSVSIRAETSNGEPIQTKYPGTWGLFRMVDSALTDAGTGEGAILEFYMNQDALRLRLRSRFLEDLYRDARWRTLECPRA